MRSRLKNVASKHGELPRRITGLALLAWEVFWAHIFVTAPRPDEEMITVAAVFFGLLLPGVIILAYALLQVFLRTLAADK